MRSTKQAVIAIGVVFVGLAIFGLLTRSSSPTQQATTTAKPAAQTAIPTSVPAQTAKPQAPPVASTLAPTATAPAKPQPTATAKPEPTASPTMPSVGDSVAVGNWQVGVMKLDSAQQLAGKRAQGAFLVVTMAAKNLHKETSILNSFDFEVTSPAGVHYKTSTDGSTALLGSPGPDVLWLSVEVQPGLTKQFRAVFDVNPDDTGLMLKAAGIQFRL